MKSTLAQRLRECRKERKITQRDVATYADITEKAYQNYELATRKPRIEILVKIADVYHVSVDYLLGRTDNKAVNK